MIPGDTRSHSSCGFGLVTIESASRRGIFIPWEETPFADVLYVIIGIAWAKGLVAKAGG